MKLFAYCALCALGILMVYGRRNDKKRLESKNVYINGPLKPETFTASEWKEILKNATNFQLDSKPTGTMSVPKTAGKVAKQAISSHIIGGLDATRGQLPWQVAMSLDSAYFCGGSLMHVNWVLTAAHCAEGIRSFFVTLGAQNRYVTESGRVVMTSREKYVHPNYDPNTVSNDVALVKLPKTVTLSEFINVIRLPKVSDSSISFEGVMATVSGWGLTKDGGTVSQTLKYLTVPVISNEECIKAFGTTYVRSSTLCTSGANKTGTCNGDSGGPLVYKEDDGLWTQIGIVSFGAVQCEDVIPSAYARVSSFLGFISSTTKVAVRKK